MSVRADVLLWAQRICGRKGSPPHVLLEIDSEATAEQAQEAFHKAARLAHPDLHRTTLTADELELVTTAYARLAGAYQELRSQRATTTRMPPLRDLPPPPARPAVAGLPRRESLPGLGGGARDPAPDDGSTSGGSPSARGVALPEPTVAKPAASGAAATMNGKALLYYRKAELSLRRGDLRGAALQLKLAIATDPASPFLRTALGEVETELAKG